jgi:Peptidase A4 family
MVFVVVGGKSVRHNCFIYRYHKQNVMAETETVRYTIPAGMTSAIVLKTIPDAVCTLGKEGQSDRALTVYADSDGLIRFHVLPTSEKPIKIIADCQAGDKSEGYPVELHPGSKPTTDKPAPPIYEPKLRAEDSVRPSLSEHEMLRLSDAELLRLGYPLRQAGLHPIIFNNWRKQVSKAVTVFHPHLISHGALEPAVVSSMRIAYSTGVTSPNWCGYLLRDDNDPNNGYCLVHAEFYVPTALGGPEDATLATSFWLGYGGYATPPFVAAGIEISDIKYTTGGETLGASAWIQNSSAQDSGAQRITKFQVDPGDDIVLEVYIWGAEREPDPWYGQPDQEGTKMGYNIYNTTKGTGATGSWLARPVSGTQVEWMVSKEPGSRDDTLGICSIYPIVYARKCTRPGSAGYPPSYETYSYNSDNNMKFTMINPNGNVIGTVDPDSISPQNLYYNIGVPEPPG